MSHYDEILTRVEPRYFGAYILSGAAPGPAMQDRERTEEQLTEEAYGVLEQLVEQPASPAKILNAAVDYGAAVEEAAFLNGLRAGARLVLRLTDDRPVFY